MKTCVSVLTSLITSQRDLPADCIILSGINGSVYDVEAMLPLSDEVVLVFDDDVAVDFDTLLLLLLLHCNPNGRTKYCFIPIICE